MLKSIALAIVLNFSSTPSALAHDYWSNGKPVPAWVKASCCGQADAHHLRPDQVHQTDDGAFYIVDGYEKKIPADQALPSQDGDYWIFYRDNTSTDGKYHSQSGVYCFFVPMEF